MASVIETLERQLVEAARESKKPARGRTSRDLEIVRWLARVRFATLDQVGRRFGLGCSQRFHRVGLPFDLGFMVRHPQLFGVGGDGL